tara:strand:- start:1769 stop:2131 length:363 start_codon:yes stop_codon:yes gene_type:complete
MPLNKPKLTADIIIAMEKAQNKNNPRDGRLTFANELAKAIDAYVRSGEVQTMTQAAGTVNPGILTNGISTPLPGTPPPPLGPVNGPIPGTPTPNGISTGAVETISVGRCSTTGTGLGKVV